MNKKRFTGKKLISFFWVFLLFLTLLLPLFINVHKISALTVAKEETTTKISDTTVEPENEGIDPKKALFEVDIKNQRVLVYYKDELLKTFICSTGNQNNSTPLGIYYTSQKIPDSYVPRFDMRAHNWIRFYGTFLFHSVPFDKEGNLLVEEVKKLGQPATHGCVRLGLNDIKWLYDTFPIGVKVFIHE